MEVAEFVMDQVWTLVATLIIGVEVWYYFIVPGIKSLRKSKHKDEDSE